MSERHTISPNMGPATEPARPSAGTLLHLAREDAGLTLDAVAQQLKLAPRRVRRSRMTTSQDCRDAPSSAVCSQLCATSESRCRAVLASLPGGSTPLPDSPLLHRPRPRWENCRLWAQQIHWTRWAIPLTLVAVIAAVAVLSSRADVTRDASTATRWVPAAPNRSPRHNQPRASRRRQIRSRTGAQSARRKGPANASAQSPTGAAPAAPAPDAAGEVSLTLTYRDSSWTDVRNAAGACWWRS
jgi:hypothetical protein